MNEKPDHCTSSADRDTMRDEYDFSDAKRGVTAARYAEGANVVVIDPKVLDVFPDGNAVNDICYCGQPGRRKFTHGALQWLLRR